MKRALVVVSVVVGVFAVAVACSEQPAAQSCRNVPDGGCPLAYGKACDDPACAAAYSCLPNGTWQLDHACPPRDASSEAPPPPPPDAGTKDVDTDVQGAFGGPGCAPLQPPDCPFGTAATCPNGCCGCEDLFVCRDGGWNPYATCIDGSIN